MLNPRSFSEILEDLQSSENRPVTDFSSGWESHLEPFGLSHVMQLMSETQLAPSYKIGIQKAYPVKRQPKAPVVRPSHQLNEAQSAALTVLKSHSPQIKDNFNLYELKSAYRLSVLKTHPDQGGNSETFQDVKKSYQILLALVKN